MDKVYFNLARVSNEEPIALVQWISSMLGPFDIGLIGNAFLKSLGPWVYPSKVTPFIPFPNKIWMVLYMDVGGYISEQEFTGKSISNVMLAVPQQVAYHHGSQ